MTAIAPLADGAFAVTSEGGKATRVAAGHRRPLAPGWDVEGGLAGFGAGDAVATSLRATEGQGPVLTIVRADGSVTPSRGTTTALWGTATEWPWEACTGRRRSR